MNKVVIALFSSAITMTLLLASRDIFPREHQNFKSSSIVPAHYSLPILQGMLRDKQYSPERKASLLFEILARHTKPEMSTKDVSRAIGSSEWLQDVEFFDTAFPTSGPEMFPGAFDLSNCSIISIKPFAHGKHSGSITFWFSTRISRVTFLSIFNESSLQTSQLLGFAIRIPHPLMPETMWRTEIWTKNTFRVMEYW